MAEMRNESNTYVSVNIERKPDGTAHGVGKVFAFIFGGIGILCSALLFLTIIGILPAIGLFYMSIGLIYLAQGKQHVACPRCKKKNVVLKTAENFTCPKCRQFTVIDWN